MAFNAAVLLAEADTAGWTRVSSSNVAAVAYSGMGGGWLFVRFKNQSVYVYDQVPRGVYDGLLAAPSKGKYMHSIVKANYYVEKLA